MVPFLQERRAFPRDEDIVDHIVNYIEEAKEGARVVVRPDGKREYGIPERFCASIAKNPNIAARVKERLGPVEYKVSRGTYLLILPDEMMDIQKTLH